MKNKIEKLFEKDYTIWGISTAAKDYRLCWLLNTYANLPFVRYETDYHYQTELGVIDVPVYGVEIEEGLQLSFYPNKIGTTWLHSSLKQADFFMIASTILNNRNTNEFTELIKNTNEVTSAFYINNDNFKEKEKELMAYIVGW